MTQPNTFDTSYPDFLKRILNPQRFSDVHVDSKAFEGAKEKWMFYQCYRKPKIGEPLIQKGGAIVYTVGGIRGGGKSALIENISDSYSKIIDVYGSRDDECLASLRMSKYRSGFDRGLIIGPPGVDVVSSYDYVPFNKLRLQDIVSHDVIVSPQRIFPKMNSFFQGTERIIDLLWSRPFAEENWFLLVREAANILFARINLKRAKMDQAKAYLILLMREMRHMGIAMGLDTQYMLSLDKEVRTNSDYSFVKNLGSDKLPGDIDWMYGWFNPLGFMSLRAREFVCKDKFGGLYAGWFKLPPWHKTPQENIYETMGIRFEVGDPIAATKEAGPDEDMMLHSEIVEAFSRIKTIKGTARETGHDAETVRKHMLKHNQHLCSDFKT
jgi:hypothetical protein